MSALHRSVVLIQSATRAVVALMLFLALGSVASAQTHTLSGVVYGGGSPLPNTNVEALTNGSTTVVAQSTTNSVGQYAVSVAAGTYDLRVTPPSGSGFGQEVVQDVEVTANRQFDVILVSSGASLSGQVLGAGGQPISGVNVSAFSSSSGQFLVSTATDTSGSYTLVVSAGQVRVDFNRTGPAALAPSQSWTYRRWNLAVSGATTFNVTLPLVTVSGGVTESGGASVANATIQANTSRFDSVTQTDLFSSGSATSNATGGYSLLLFPGTANFTARPPTGSTATPVFENNVALSGNLTRNFVLGQAIAVSGTVRGAGGQAVPSVTVEAFSSSTGQLLGGTTTNASGFYTLGVAVGQIRLDFRRSGPAGLAPPSSWTYRRKNLAVSSATTFDVALPVVTLSGSVKDATGVVANASVQATTSNIDATTEYFSNSTVVSSATGTYSVLLFPGTAIFTVRPPSGSTAVPFVHRDVTFTSDIARDFVFGETPAVSGTVRGVGGVPISGANVSAFSSTTGQFLINTTTNASGLYALGVSGGQIRLDFNSSGASTIAPTSWTYRKNNLQMSGLITLDVNLSVVRLNGSAADSNGTPVPNVNIQVNTSKFDSGTNSDWFSNASVNSDSAGLYSMLLLTGTGQLSVRPITTSGFAQATLNNVTFNTNVTQRIVLQRPDTTPPLIVTAPAVLHLSDTSVSIGWTTNEPATSIVDYGLGNLDTAKASSVLVTSHSVTLVDLLPHEIYSFRVRSVDRGGNGPAQSGTGFFTMLPPPGDIAAPVISGGPAATFVGDSSAIIQWTTDEPASSLVRYGETIGLGTVVGSPLGEFLGAHSLLLPGLTPSTTYFARVESVDPDGNSIASSMFSFTTRSEPDTLPPTVSGLTVVAVTDTRITVAWATNEAATSGVSYNDGTVFNVTSDDAFTTSHEVTLAGLTPQRTYNITVASKDAAGNGPTLAGPIQATTRATPDTTSPAITAVSAEPTKNTAVMRWTTNEPATSAVYFGAVSGALDQILTDLSLATAHAVSLTGLQAGTTYYFSVRSIDGSNNATTSPESSFSTVADTVNVPPSAPGPVTVSPNPSSTGNFTITWGASTDDGPGGVRSYEVLRDGIAVVSLSPGETSYAEFGLDEGSFQYRIRATDFDNASSLSNVVTLVVDQTAPQLAVPADISTPATTGSDAIVSYAATATDNTDPTPILTCTPPSGSAFVIGSTEVSCTATDAAGNEATGTFTVRVTDPFKPVLTVPANMTVDATSAAGATVNYVVSATDNADTTPTVECSAESGNVFPVGTTTVSCTATDDSGNAATGTFDVTVVATVDTDGDGVVDDSDNCPAIANSLQNDSDSDGPGDACDACPLDAANDADGDGICGNIDNCSLAPNTDQKDIDADGAGDVCDTDDDNDAVADAVDNCPLAANADQVNTDGDGAGDACDLDDDNDGSADVTDNCALVANADQVNTDGDGAGDACDSDDDNDAVADVTDNCKLVANANQTDTDGDGAGNACDSDDDGDSIQDGVDNCSLAANADQANNDGDAEGDVCDTDDDNDSVKDATDNCAVIANTDQANNDGDTQGDVCDSDDDNDSIADATDNCARTPNVDQTNTDADALGDACDQDDDGDGVLDTADNCALTSNSTQTNTDADAFGDACDADDDNDSITDASDNCPLVENTSQQDNDGDGVGNICDVSPKGTTAAVLTSSPNPSSFLQTVTVKAVVAPVAPSNGTPTGTVEFFDGGTSMGSALVGVDGTATLTTSGFDSGAHTLTAAYGGDVNFQPSNSAPITHTVQSQSASTRVALTVTPQASSALNEAVLLEAVVSPLSGSGNPAGEVWFYDGAVLIGTGTVGQSRGNMRAQLTVSTLAVGFHSLTARYVGGGPFGSSTSAPVAHTVYDGSKPAATTTTLTTTPNPSPYGQAVTLTAEVSAKGKTQPTGGLVQFYVDGVAVGSLVTLNSNRQATFAISTMSRGIHTLTAQYLGGGTFAASTGQTFHVVQ